MAHKWRDIRRTLTDEDEAHMKSWVAEELARIPLAEMRRARQLTQVRMAELLQVNQGAISKLERRVAPLLGGHRGSRTTDDDRQRS